MDTSPDCKCPICLGRLDNIAYLDNCWHRFCFDCVRDWTKASVQCPLCKLPFSSIFHTVRADNDFQEYKVAPAAGPTSSSLQGSPSTIAQSPRDLHVYGPRNYYNYATAARDEGRGSGTAVLADLLGSEHSSPASGAGQSPCDAETAGPLSFPSEKRGATAASPQELLQSSGEGSAWKRSQLQPRARAGADTGDGDFSSEHADSAGCVAARAERTPDVTELSSDSEESVGREKREDKEKEQAMRRLSRKRKTRRPPACPENSDSSPGPEPRKKHHSEHRLKKRRPKSRDGSKRQSKRSRRSRPHGTSLSLQSQRGSSSPENTASRAPSRALLAHHRDHGQGASSSEDSDHPHRRGCSCSQCQWDCPAYRPRTDRDGPSCRKRSRSRSRSRSPSGDTGRTRSEKPGGRRKCKTQHPEKVEKGSTSTERENGLKRLVPASGGCYRNKGSLSDSQVSYGAEPRKKKRKTRSLSVESV